MQQCDTNPILSSGKWRKEYLGAFESIRKSFVVFLTFFCLRFAHFKNHSTNQMLSSFKCSKKHHLQHIAREKNVTTRKRLTPSLFPRMFYDNMKCVLLLLLLNFFRLCLEFRYFYNFPGVDHVGGEGEIAR